MRSLNFFLVLVLFVGSSFADEITVDKTYLGLLSWAQVTYPSTAYLPVSARAGIAVSTTSGFRAIGVGEYATYCQWVAGALWWEKGVFSIGRMPRPVGMLNTPHPSTPSAHFLSPYKEVMPGLAFGSKLKFSNVMVGLYGNGSTADSLELNLAVWKEVSNIKVNISGYVAQYSQCVVAGVESGKFGVTVHQSVFKNGPDIFSCGGYYIADKFSYYLSYVKKTNTPPQAEIGYWWELEGKKINGLLNPAIGIGNDMWYFATYLQIYLR